MWRRFFDDHADRYDENRFTQATEAEVAFLVDLLALEPGSRLLDLGCGTGRHAVALAARGFRVTGVDLSPRMLDVARRKAAAADVEVEWVEADATAWRAPELFDAGVCLCEGGFGLAGEGEDPVAHDTAILATAAAALRPGALFVLTALNGYRVIRRVTDADVEAGRFDPTTMVAHVDEELDLPEGRERVRYTERQLVVPELVALLGLAGFDVEHVWGGTAGDWGRRPLRLDEMEAMYVARRRP